MAREWLEGTPWFHKEISRLRFPRPSAKNIKKYILLSHAHVVTFLNLRKSLCKEVYVCVTYTYTCMRFDISQSGELLYKRRHRKRDSQVTGLQG